MGKTTAINDDASPGSPTNGSSIRRKFPSPSHPVRLIALDSDTRRNGSGTHGRFLLVQELLAVPQLANRRAQRIGRDGR
jgi:hypothetical protein